MRLNVLDLVVAVCVAHVIVAKGAPMATAHHLQRREPIFGSSLLSKIPAVGSLLGVGKKAVTSILGPVTTLFSKNKTKTLQSTSGSLVPGAATTASTPSKKLTLKAERPPAQTVKPSPAANSQTPANQSSQGAQPGKADTNPSKADTAGSSGAADQAAGGAASPKSKMDRVKDMASLGANGAMLSMGVSSIRGDKSMPQGTVDASGTKSKSINPAGQPQQAMGSADDGMGMAAN